MSKRLWFLAIVAIVAIVTGIPGTISPTLTAQNEKPVLTAQEAAIAKDFTQRVKEYVALQKRLESSLPGLRSTKDSVEIDAHTKALRAKLIEARPNMQQGNIFTGEISAQFKEIIRKTFQEPGAQIVRRTVNEGDPPKPITIRVNGIYPDDSPVVTTPPTLLNRLPELPMELSYRILGHTFVLLDNKTNLIVDYITSAIP